MKALSIKQPWAWLIAAGYKDVENRHWRTNFRGTIYIHAGQSVDFNGFSCFRIGRLDSIYSNEFPLLAWLRGAIIGQVDIVDCVTASESPWFVGPYGFVLANPALYDKPIPCKGRLGFFEPDIPTPPRINPIGYVDK